MQRVRVAMRFFSLLYAQLNRGRGQIFFDELPTWGHGDVVAGVEGMPTQGNKL